MTTPTTTGGALTAPISEAEIEELRLQLYTPESRDVVDRILTERAADKHQIDRLATALHEIDRWSRAYPLKVFPETGLQESPRDA